MKIRLALAAAEALVVLSASAHSIHAQTLLYELASPTEEEFGQFGVSVSAVPDLDGDGRTDMIIGARGELNFRGRAHVFSGATGTPLYYVTGTSGVADAGTKVAGCPDLSGDGRGDLLVYERALNFDVVNVYSGVDGAFIRTLRSPDEAFGFFGYALAGVGDLNGDGASEILIGARMDDIGRRVDAGRVYLFDGATGVLLHVLGSPHKVAQGFFSQAVAGVPDTDGDGVTDLLVGAPNESLEGTFPNSGRAYLYSGATGALLLELTSPNMDPRGHLGFALSGLRDVNGDGRGDLLIAAPYEDYPGNVKHVGRAYLFSGADGTLLSTLESPNAQMDGLFGVSTSAVPDLDGDGKDDVLIGAFLEATGGRAYVFSGASGALLSELSSPHPEEFGFFGFSVAGLDDVNSDGRGDLLVSAYYEGDGTPGRAYVFSGGNIAP